MESNGAQAAALSETSPGPGLQSGVDFALSLGKTCLIAGWAESANDCIAGLSLQDHAGQPVELEMLWLSSPDIDASEPGQENVAPSIRYFFAIGEGHSEHLLLLIGEESHSLFVKSEIDGRVCSKFEFYGGLLRRDIVYQGKFKDKAVVFQNLIDIIGGGVADYTFSMENNISPIILYVDGVERINDSVRVFGWFALSTDYTNCFICIAYPSDLKLYSFDEIVRKRRSDIDKYLGDNGQRDFKAYAFEIIVPERDGFPSRVVLLADDKAVSVRTGNIKKSNSLEFLSRLLENPFALTGPIGEFAHTVVSQAYGTKRSTDAQPVLVLDQDIGVDPEISFIIPLGSRWDFIKYQMAMFDRLARSWTPFEVVYVICDPDIEHTIRRYVAYCPFRAFAVKILTMDMKCDAAFGKNAGAREARGTYLFFMSPDVYIVQSETLIRGIAQVDRASTAIVGFTLLFDDDTLQHDGISLDESNSYLGYVMPRHPGKGLPWALGASQDVRPCTLVSGALMLMRRTVFDALGGFPQNYVLGDFEDIEICLKASRIGQNLLCRGPGLYRLERQTPGTTESGLLRQAIRLSNAHEFWSRGLNIPPHYTNRSLE